MTDDHMFKRAMARAEGTGRQQCFIGGKLGSGDDDQGGLSDSQDALGERITVR
jgi:hypothetical protein